MRRSRMKIVKDSLEEKEASEAIDKEIKEALPETKKEGGEIKKEDKPKED